MTALVTGASKGIGRVIAEQLAADGYDLALVGRDTASLKEVKEAVTENPDIKAISIEADLSDINSCSRIVEETVKAFGGLDLLVNCAGLSHKGSFTTVTPEEWDRIFAVNAKAHANAVRVRIEMDVGGMPQKSHAEKVINR